MTEPLHDELVWCLQALAQDADIQRSLYPEFVVVADELALDFDDALQLHGPDVLKTHPDLAQLLALIESKSGQEGYWFGRALEESEFWADIRKSARAILHARDLPSTIPDHRPHTVYYVEGKTIWLDRVLAWIRQRF
ncbi:MAG: hypothetical protein AAFW87_03935 [Pseudomonadota bacterium]